MRKKLTEVEFIKALLNPLCTKPNWQKLFANYETTLYNHLQSSSNPLETLNGIDYALSELAAIKACGVQKKCTVFCS